MDCGIKIVTAGLDPAVHAEWQQTMSCGESKHR